MISAIISRSCGERAEVLGKRAAALVADGPKCDNDIDVDDDDEVVADNICATPA